jgi:hypothetical protein
MMTAGFPHGLRWSYAVSYLPYARSHNVQGLQWFGVDFSSISVTLESDIGRASDTTSVGEHPM